MYLHSVNNFCRVDSKSAAKMEVHNRRLRTVHIQEQENVHVIKEKVPIKKPGLAVRGALGDLNTNAQVQREINVAKVAFTTAEFEEKSTSTCRAGKSSSHVHSEVETGRAFKPVQPSSRPPLRREENTVALAAKDSVRSRAIKESSRLPDKENMGISIPARKVVTKKPTKLVSIKEIRVASTTSLEPILEEPTESLGKLPIEEKPSIIDTEKLKNHPSLPKERKSSVNLEKCLVIPDDIEDIDAADSNTLTLMTAYIKDIYRYLLELENRFPIEQDYLKNQSDITPKARATLIDWLVDVHREFKQHQESFHLTVSIIDRYLQATPNVGLDQLQLIGVTAMLLACKYEEVHPPDVAHFVYVTGGTYTKCEILRCERAIFMKLGCCLAKPVPLYFLRRFVKAARGDSKRHNLSKYLVDLCLVEYCMVQYRPSELSAAALCLSLRLLSGASLEEVWTPTLAFYSGYHLEHLHPIVRQIARIVANVDNSKFKSVHKKYSSVTNFKVSTLPELKGPALYQLADLPSKQ